MDSSWKVEKIAVIGAGIVGIPMAAALAHARIRIGTENPAEIVLIQRDSPTSGWKVAAINRGISPLGDTESDLIQKIRDSVSEGILRASHDMAETRTADVILVCVQTDKNGLEPDYGPLFGALDPMVTVLKQRPRGKVPLIIIESTLAPTSMMTTIQDFFEQHGLKNGTDIRLGNSPNRVMPGFLLERIRTSDKIVGGLDSSTPELIRRIYSYLVTDATLHLTNSVTAEIVKTLENAYRDVRIAYSTEVSRYCDRNSYDYYVLRDEVNKRLAWEDTASFDSECTPVGGMLIPNIGVGGHCLPKDGILLLWRWNEAGLDISDSLIVNARRINDESPFVTFKFMEQCFGDLSGKAVTLMGAAYKQNSMDTRNSPTLVLGRILLDAGCDVTVHDPYVRPDDNNLRLSGLDAHFKTDLVEAASTAEILVFAAAHRIYREEYKAVCEAAPRLSGIFDGCNLFSASDFQNMKQAYFGVGKGNTPPPEYLIEAVFQGFKGVESGFSHELAAIIADINERYVSDEYNRSTFQEVKRLAETCVTGCYLGEPETLKPVVLPDGYSSELVDCVNNRHAQQQ